MNSVFATLPVSVFEVMSRLAREHDAVNLGQGFPDGPFPEDVLAKAADAVVNGWNQYPPMMGLPELREAVSVNYKHWQNLDFDPESEIMITSGATEAIAGALIAMPGMRERCVKIGSAGKIFSLTGWKVGLVCAAPNVLRVLAKAHQYITFTTPPNLQAAVSYGLGKADDYFEGMRRDLQRSRDRFTSGLRSLGFPVIDAEATYFVNVDLATLGLNEDDESFCKRLVLAHKVAAIPVSAFYATEPIRTVVRFCFAKRDATLDTALERLAGALKRAA